LLAEIPGAVELSNWFGGFPSFHDATMDLQINGDGTGWLKAYGFQATKAVDEKGHFICEKYFEATLNFEFIKTESVTDFLPGLAIVGSLHIRKVKSGFEVDFTDTSYELSGSLICERVSVSFEPGAKAP